MDDDTADPVVFAATQARRFTGRQLRIGRSPVVHDVAWKDWLADLALPAPACNQGWAGHAATDDLTATTDPATCRKCALTTGRTAHRQAPPFQTTLFNLDIDLDIDVDVAGKCPDTTHGEQSQLPSEADEWSEPARPRGPLPHEAWDGGVHDPN